MAKNYTILLTFYVTVGRVAYQQIRADIIAFDDVIRLHRNARRQSKLQMMTLVDVGTVLMTVAKISWTLQRHALTGVSNFVVIEARFFVGLGVY